jgi:hypothetical protein
VSAIRDDDQFGVPDTLLIGSANLERKEAIIFAPDNERAGRNPL